MSAACPLRWMLIGMLCLYRRIPQRWKKRRCLFQETCSTLALRTAREEGVLACHRAMRRRFAVCRPRYFVFYSSTSGQWQVKLADGTVIHENEVAAFVLEPYRVALFPDQSSGHSGGTA